MPLLSPKTLFVLKVESVNTSGYLFSIHSCHSNSNGDEIISCKASTNRVQIQAQKNGALLFQLPAII